MTALDAARAWARSGLMALCGDPSGPPLLPPLGAPSKLEAVAGDIARLTAASGRTVAVHWDALLAGRAHILGLTRHGRTSANGSCRLLTAADGDVAVNLPREDDRSLVAALTGHPLADTDPWRAVSEMARTTPAAEFVARARLLGLGAARAGERSWPSTDPSSDPYDPYDPYDPSNDPIGCSSMHICTKVHPAASGSPRTGPLPCASSGRCPPRKRDPDNQTTVVDLSSLWAGPTAARVLAESGARVIKVEDPTRPDGARRQPAFYSWIHPANEIAEQIQFATTPGRARLAALIDNADVVIESSRPRALEQLGLAPEDRTGPPGQVWLSITGHGRTGVAREWTGFGDDAAVAGGLICKDARGTSMFCGDAIADPIAGLVGALAVLQSLDSGGGDLIDVSLAGVAAWVASTPSTASTASPASTGPQPVEVLVERDGEHWFLVAGDIREQVASRPPALDWI